MAVLRTQPIHLFLGAAFLTLLDGTRTRGDLEREMVARNIGSAASATVWVADALDEIGARRPDGGVGWRRIASKLDSTYLTYLREPLLGHPRR